MNKYIITALAAIVAITLSACGSEPIKTASVKPKATATVTATATPSPEPDSDNDGVIDQYDAEPYNPAVISVDEDEDAPTEDEDAPTEDAAGNQTVKSIGQWGEDEDMKVKVISMKKVDYIPAVNEFYDPVKDKAGSSLIAVRIEVKNNGKQEIDPLCAVQGFVLLDEDDRNFDPLDSVLDINDNVCGDGIQPGFKSSYTLAYRLPAGSKIGGLVVWNDEGDDYDGEESNILFTT